MREAMIWRILYLTAWLGSMIVVVDSYPMIVEVPEESERCIRLNIPEDDDAHLVFLALPSPATEKEKDEEDKFSAKWAEDQKALETHFMSRMLELTRTRVHSTIPRKFSGEPPEEISQMIKGFLHQLGGDLKARCKIKLSNPLSTSNRIMDTFWFTPVVINHVRQAVRGRPDEGKESPLEGYSICISNDNINFPVQVVVDSVVTSETIGDSEEDDKTPVFESSDLTPLAEQLGESIIAARSVLDEMMYMEKREQRMRKTADSINARVRYFSYISVIVLLVVTYLQVTYLKRYFRKKKLL